MSKVKDCIRNSISWQFLQPFWRECYKISMAGMNYGGGYGLEQSGELVFLKSWADHLKNQEKFSIIDGGANLGDFTKYCLSYFPLQVSIECFEPQSYELEVLKKNYSHDPRVAIHPVAIASKPGKITLYGRAGAASFYAWNVTKYGCETQQEVEMVTLDQTYQKDEPIGLLKMDVEGNEYDILLGASKLIASDKIVAMMWEFGEPNIGSRIFLKDFYELLTSRYQLYRVLSHGLDPIISYDVELEIFKTCNLVAIHRTHPYAKGYRF